jgi:hypothetical protein
MRLFLIVKAYDFLTDDFVVEKDELIFSDSNPLIDPRFVV